MQERPAPRRSLPAQLTASIFTLLALTAAPFIDRTPDRWRGGTPKRRRRGRGGLMKPALRISRITGTFVGQPRHASSNWLPPGRPALQI